MSRLDVLNPGRPRAPFPALASRLLLPALGLATALAGCAPDPVAVLDLAANPDLAAFQPDTRIVDFGTPGARDVLQNGWNTLDERWLGERTFVWGRGAASRIRFQAFRHGGRNLRFVARPNPAYGDRGLAMTVVLNGQPLETIEVRPGWLEYRVRLPEAAVQPGPNRLEFHYRAGDAEPAEGDFQVAWDILRLGPSWEYGFPGVDSSGDDLALQVPFFSELEYFVDADPGAVLSLERVSVYGEQIQGRTASLEIDIRAEEALEPVRYTIGADEFDRAHEFPLDLDRARPVSVSIRALPGYEPGRASGLLLTGARLTGGEATAPTGAQLPSVAGAPPLEPLPNVIVYLVDTLRADHLGLYGYDRPTSPRLDAFGADSTVFDLAFTQSGWTRTSVASIFTGLLPTAHGVNGRDDALDPAAVTLAGVLRDHGYTTVGWTTNGNVSDQFGFRIGFDRYSHLRERRTPEIHVLAHELGDEFFAWLDGRDDSQPFFAYLHASDPHDPYAPLPEFRSRFPSPRTTGVVQPRAVAEAKAQDPTLTDEILRADLVALYDAEVAQNDDAFGALLDGLRERGIYDDTIVVFLADHGEEFLDHGRWAHGKTLYREMIRTPLVIRIPGAPAGRTRQLAQHVDLLPTLVELVGAEVPREVQGGSLVPWLLDPTTEPAATTVRSYLDLDGYSLASLIDPRHHLVRSGMSAPGVSLGGAELFDLLEDPAERRDLRPVYRVRTGLLLSRLRLLERGETLLHEPGEAEIDDELRDRLRALGYIQ